MATRTKVTSQKRNRERARQEAQKEKARRRAVAKEQKVSAGPRRAGDEDPDLAGIVAGPQPHPWADEDEFKDDEDVQDDEKA